jgi:hypothetical protein
VTDPVGKSTTFTMDSYVADGTNWCPWVFDQVGDWTIDFYYPGEYFAPGRYFEGVIIDAATGGTVYADGATINPATARTVTITVQSDIVPGWPESPLPTNYWTRPVGEENRDWWTILGAYPWMGYGEGAIWDMLYPNTNPTYNSAYGFVPWVSGPESAHIVWKREYQIAGLLGGDYGVGSSVNPDTLGAHSSVSSDWRMVPNIILAGRAYHAVAKPATDGPAMQTYWECYDIRTGEIIWERPLYPGETTPTLIEYTFAGQEVPGSQAKPYSPVLLSIANGYLLKYNANSGLLMYNVSIAPMTGNGGTYYKNGYVLGVQDLGTDAGAERYRLINWTTFGSSANFATRVVSNTTYARSALPTNQLTDWNTGIGCTVTSVTQGGMFIGMTLQAFDLMTGVLLWNKTIDEPIYSASANVADHGKLAVLSDSGYYLAFDLRSGNQVWQTRTLDYPWDAPGWGAYSVTSGYGQLYWDAQSGIYAIDWDTGDINWKFEKEAPPFETPYTGSEGQTVYPFIVGSLCTDGKLYVYSAKHTPEQPFYRGQPTVCIDVFTGEEKWSIGMTGSTFNSRGQLAVADGYLTLGGRDGVMYVFGIGKSETTVAAPQTVVPSGQKVLLTGSVLDLSIAQSGAPCVAKESVAAQMEHIHMQVGVGGVFDNVTMIGVDVILYANDVYIGTVKSDGYSGTFAFDDWAPDSSGLYTITATFMGDESYGMSSATTYLTVAENQESSKDNTLLYAVICATIAIIITVILCALIFRKK